MADNQEWRLGVRLGEGCNEEGRHVTYLDEARAILIGGEHDTVNNSRLG